MQRVVLGRPPAQNGDPFQRVPSSWEHGTDVGKEITPAGAARSDSSPSEHGAVTWSVRIPAEATVATFSFLPPASVCVPSDATHSLCLPGFLQTQFSVASWVKGFPCRTLFTLQGSHSWGHTPTTGWQVLYFNLPLLHTSVCIFLKFHFYLDSVFLLFICFF